MYKAQNVDTEKMLEELDNMQDRAVENHYRKNAIEKARFEQEYDDIQRFKEMFFCSNYEKTDNPQKECATDEKS